MDRLQNSCDGTCDWKIWALLRAFKQLCGDYQKFTSTCTVEGKLKKLLDAKVLLRAAFFTDVLTEAKRFSLVTQEKNINVI